MDGEAAKKKWDNYWYYYKWHTLAGIFIIFVLIVSIRSCVTRINPDISIILRTDFYVPEETVAKMENNLKQYCKDYNNDKKVVVSIDTYYFSDKSNPQMQAAYSQKLIAQLAAGEVLVISGDKGYMDTLDKEQVFIKLPGQQGTMIKLNDTKFIKDNGIKLEGDVYLGLRDFSGKKGGDLTRYNNNLEFLSNMLTDKKTK